jgi:hypothetical protein
MYLPTAIQGGRSRSSPEALQPRRIGAGSTEVPGFCGLIKYMPMMQRETQSISQNRNGSRLMTARSGSRENSMLQKKGGQKDRGKSAERTESKGESIDIRPVKVRVFEKICIIFTFLQDFMV